MEDDVEYCLCGKAILLPETNNSCSNSCSQKTGKQKQAAKQRPPQVQPGVETAPEQEKPQSGISQKEQPSTDLLNEPPLPRKKKRTRSRRKRKGNASVPLPTQPVEKQPPKPSKRKQSARQQPVGPTLQRSSLPWFPLLPALGTDADPQNAHQFSLGRNIPAKMALLEGIASTRQLGYTAIQFFLAHSESWPLPLIAPEHVLPVSQALAQFSPVLIHAPLLIDLASQKEARWLRSLFLLRTVLHQARQLGVHAVVVHLTNYRRPSSVSQSQETVKHLVKGIVYSLIDSPSQPTTRLLLENGYCSPGAKVEELGALLNALPSPCQPHVGICLDTAHCWSAGYDLSSVKGASCLLQSIESSIGLGRIHAIHLNDAKYKLGEKRDEHAQWGKGQISARGIQGIQYILQDPRLTHCALILETPLLKNEQGYLDWKQEQQHLAIVKDLLLAPRTRLMEPAAFPPSKRVRGVSQESDGARNPLTIIVVPY